MYNFEEISASYEFCTCITFADGHKSSFRKVEHIEAIRDKFGFKFTFEGSEDETFDGKEPDDWGAIFLELGKKLYPYTLQVGENGELIGVQDFDELKERWLTSRDELLENYEHNFEVKKVAFSYAYSLNSERMFLSLLRRNLFFHLLFWQDNLPSQEIEIKDFPDMSSLSVFLFQRGIEENGYLCYNADTVYEKDAYNLVGGNCTMKIRRGADGLPDDVSLVAKVEKRYRGYYTEEITLRRM